MDLTILAAIFIATNIWGLYGKIPFTAIQPSRSVLDRAVGSFQLTSTLHTLGHIHPYFLPKTTQAEPMCPMDTGEDNIMRGAMADFIHSRDTCVMGPAQATATRIDNTSFATAIPMFMATNQPLSNEQLSKPESSETVHNTVVLAMLIGILSILTNDITRRITITKEIRLLRNEIHNFITDQEDYHKSTTYECLQRLAQLREGMNALFTVGNGLLDLPDRLPSAIARTVASSVADQFNNPTSGVARHLCDIQDDLQQFHERVGQNISAWKELAELLRGLPSNVAAAIASSVAAEIAGSRSMSADKTANTHKTDLGRSIWADKTWHDSGV